MKSRRLSGIPKNTCQDTVKNSRKKYLTIIKEHLPNHDGTIWAWINHSSTTHQKKRHGITRKKNTSDWS